MVLVGVANLRDPIFWPLRDGCVQQTGVLGAQSPSALGFAAKSWNLQLSSEVGSWVARVASPPGS